MICYHLTHAQARMLLNLLKASGLCMVCDGNVSSKRHIYRKSFDNTRQHIFLKTDARISRSQWSLNCICTDSVTPKLCSQIKFGIPRIYAADTFFSRSDMTVVKVRDAP